MKNAALHQEILLVTTSSLSKRQLADKKSTEGARHLSPAEQLEDACWNGLLDELIPEIIEKPASGKKLFLWHIRHGQNFLQIELSEFPLNIEKRFSIDTHFFLSEMNGN